MHTFIPVQPNIKEILHILLNHGVTNQEIAEFQKLIVVYLSGGMDCLTASCAGVAGSSPIEKEQKFVLFASSLSLSFVDTV